MDSAKLDEIIIQLYNMIDCSKEIYKNSKTDYAAGFNDGQVTGLKLAIECCQRAE